MIIYINMIDIYMYVGCLLPQYRDVNQCGNAYI